MLDQKTSGATSSTAGGWRAASILDFITDAARSIGVGTTTDAGWAPPPQAGTIPIMMTGGIPDPASLPRQELLSALAKVLDDVPSEALRYGGTQGFEVLREALAQRSAANDRIEQGPDNFVLTNGSAGGIDLICSAFINPGDIVLTESPTFSGTLRTFRGHQARLISVPMDNDGMDTDALAETLERQQRAGDPVKAIYTIPDFHNPMGVSMTLERRRRLVELSNEYRVIVIEDDAYADLGFDAEPLPSVYSVAGGQGVLRACTFSKTIATGLRVGWVQGRADFVDACVRMRFDMGASPLLHRALAEFVISGGWERHIKKMHRIYSEKCEALASTLIEECEPYARFVRPQGGFFIWLECREGLDSARVAQLASEEGVLVVPGRNFFMEQNDSSHLRLALSTETPDDLREGARRLARAFARAAG
ncbi:MAG TPA: PLP-dependent aminotransferase family protein [Dehalococcoidia bacterium]|nr:PLP-dependent aminotransferase family protein [Dehalococcoidia bacterium]